MGYSDGVLGGDLPSRRQGIFICYRRDDAQGFALAVYKAFAQRFGRSRVFMDVDSIEPGLDFRDVIARTLDRCGVLLILIGRRWLSASDARGQRRLDDPADLVRLEIEGALERGIRVIPVLVDGSVLPTVRELPESLVVLVRRQVVKVDADRFDRDIAALIRALGGPASAVRRPWLAAVAGLSVVLLGVVLAARLQTTATPSDATGLADDRAPRGLLGAGRRRADAVAPSEGLRSEVLTGSQGLAPPLPRPGLAGATRPGEADCGLPKADASDLVILSALSGGQVSTVTVAGQDVETNTARIVVDEGQEPLYLIFSSYYSQIWRFEGDVARVKRVALIGPREQGVVGLPADRVVDLTRPVSSLTETRCFRPFNGARSVDAVLARGIVERAVGQPVSAVVASDERVVAAHLPSAQVEIPTRTFSRESAPPGFDQRTYEDAMRFDPGGLVEIDPETVVSAAPAARYEVLPSGWGIAQLIATGALVVDNGTYWITEPIARFPAGLGGARAVDFVLAKGVPLPKGSAGHSCVVSEETGAPLTDGPRCNR